MSDFEITAIPPPTTHIPGSGGPVLILPPQVTTIPTSTVTVSPFESPTPQERKQTGREISIRSTAEAARLVYGSVRTGGLITFAHAGQETELDVEHLHLVVTIAGHQVDDITALYLDGEAVTFGAATFHTGGPPYRWGAAGTKWDDLVFMSESLGAEDQVANADLVGQSDANFLGKWTANHRQRGFAHAYIILKFDPDVFPSGLPKIEFGVQGKDDIYDPRDTSNKYTRNAALIIADYLCDSKLGLGADYSTEIDETNLTEAANICDESVSILPSGSESRYTIDGVIDTSRSPRDILQDMSNAIAGPIVYSEGKWKIFPGEYRTPTVTLTEDDLRSDVKVQTKQSRRSTINAVAGTHINSSGKVVDFPAVRNATYEAEDGSEVLWTDINLPLVQSPAACQRISKILLEDNRQDIVIEANFGLKAFQLAAEDNVYITLDRFGFSSKVFRVVKWLPVSVQNGDSYELQISLTLKETASGIYSWSTEETEVDLAPNTTLPDPTSVDAITGLTLESGTDHLYERADGTVFSRVKVSWDALTDPYATLVEVEYKQSADSDFLPATTVSSSQTNVYVLDVQDGVNYDFRVRAVNPLGYKSSWTTSLFHTVIGKTANPSDVTNLSASVGSYGILLTWDAVTDKDLSHYVIKNGDTVLANAFSNTYTWEIQTAASYTINVYAVDTSGNVSTNTTSLAVTIASPGSPSVTSSIDEADVVLSWDEVAKAANGFAIDAYEISYGSTYGASTALNETKSSYFRTRVTWGDTRKFWIVTRDVAGNRSTEVSVDVDIAEPGSPTNFAASVIDNNVQLTWTAPTVTSLPIVSYNVYRGDTFGAATLLGNITGTFKTIFETTKGTRTYWVTAVDTAGNESTEVSVTAVVLAPPDYVLTSDAQQYGQYAESTTNVLIGMQSEDQFANFNPNDFGDCQLWLKADAGVTKNGSDQVETWADQSGSGNDVSQTVDSAFRPIWTDNLVNGLPGLDFDGSDDYLQLSNGLEFSQVTSFVVFESNLDATIHYIMGAGDTTNVGWYTYCQSDGDLHFVIGDGTTNEDANNQNIVTANTVEIGIGRYDLVNVLSRHVDQSETVTDQTHAETDAISYTGIDWFRIGSLDTHVAGRYLDGRVYEVLVFDGALSDANVKKIQNYLAHRWFPKANRYDETQDNGKYLLPVDTGATLQDKLQRTVGQFTSSNSEYLSRAAGSLSDVRFSNESFCGFCWFQLDTQGSGVNHRLFARWGASAAARAFSLQEVNGTAYIFVQGSSGYNSASVSGTNVDTLHFLYFEHNQGSTIKISLDGGTLQSTAHTIGVTDATEALTIGQGNSQYYTNGKIGPCGLIPGTLTSDEITEIYNSGFPRSFENLPSSIRAYFDGTTSSGSYWDMDEASGTRVDSGASGNDLTDNNTVTSSTVAIGTSNTINVRDFTSANSEYFSITDGSQSGLDVTGDFWIAGWFYLDAKQSQDVIVEKYAGSGDERAYSVHWNNSAVALRMFASSDGTAGNTSIASSSAAIDTGTWYFFLAYHDNGTEIGIGVNGGAFNTAAHTGGVHNSTAPFHIFRDNDTGTYTDGKASRIAIGNSLAWTPAEIASFLYNNGNGRLYEEMSNAEKSALGIVSYWDLTEASGNALDSHGSNDLTDNNTVAQTTKTSAGSLQDLIDAGYTYTVMPTPSTGSTQQIVDYGTSISSSLITVSWSESTVAGTISTSCQIDYSSDGSSWTSATAGDTQVFASSFRFVRVTITVTPDDDKSFATISNLRIRLDVKETQEHGVATAASGDSGGTTVNISKSFIDIKSITGSVNGTSFGVPGFSWTDPNATSFKLFLWDATGARMSGDVSYTITGVESND